MSAGVAHVTAGVALMMCPARSARREVVVARQGPLAMKSPATSDVLTVVALTTSALL